MKYRIEHDSMGEMQVPADRYWAAQTQRSSENFKIGVGIETMPREITRAFGMLKKAAALANNVLRPEKMTDEKLNAIPITSDVPSDAEMWIDPDEETVEESHINNKNNPHGVTVDQIGAAPSGYGLGGGCKSINSVFNISANGWWITNGDTPSDVWLLCQSRVTNNSNDITVDAWNMSGTAKYKITKRNGTWGEWESEFPLMTAGKEYRTTERHNGKTVWTVLADVGTCPTGETIVNTSFTATGIVRWDGNDCIYESARNDKYLRTKRVSIVSGKLAVTNIFGTQVGSSHEYCRIWYTKD